MVRNLQGFTAVVVHPCISSFCHLLGLLVPIFVELVQLLVGGNGTTRPTAPRGTTFDGTACPTAVGGTAVAVVQFGIERLQWRYVAQVALSLPVVEQFLLTFFIILEVLTVRNVDSC